jgi:hypothetical protein
MVILMTLPLWAPFEIAIYLVIVGVYGSAGRMLWGSLMDTPVHLWTQLVREVMQREMPGSDRPLLFEMNIPSNG